jgi:hypothetical protein
MWNHILGALSCSWTHLQRGWSFVKISVLLQAVVLLISDYSQLIAGHQQDDSLKKDRYILTREQSRWRCVHEHESAPRKLFLMYLNGTTVNNSQGLFWDESTQFLVLIPISSRPILILSSHLRLGLPKGLYPVGLPFNILKTLLPSCILATCPAHLNLLDLIP